MDEQSDVAERDAPWEQRPQQKSPTQRYFEYHTGRGMERRSVLRARRISWPDSPEWITSILIRF